MIHEYIPISNAPLICEYLGVLGFLLYMVTFAALQFQWIDGNSVTYTIVSVLAAMLVLISLMEDFNLASALIQIAWITIGTCGLAVRLVKIRMVKAPAKGRVSLVQWQTPPQTPTNQHSHGQQPCFQSYRGPQFIRLRGDGNWHKRHRRSH